MIRSGKDNLNRSRKAREEDYSGLGGVGRICDLVHALLRVTAGKTDASERHPYPWGKASPIRVGRSLRDLRVLAHPRPEIEGHRVEPLHRIADAPGGVRRPGERFAYQINQPPACQP